jgi:hypothetical protein
MLCPFGSDCARFVYAELGKCSTTAPLRIKIETGILHGYIIMVIETKE